MTSIKDEIQDEEIKTPKSLAEEVLSSVAVAVCAHFTVSLDDFKSKSREGIRPFARQIFFHIMERQGGFKDEVIAAFVNRNRTTVVNGKKVIRNLIDMNQLSVEQHVESIEQKLDLFRINELKGEIQKLKSLETEKVRQQEEEVLSNIARSVSNHFNVSFDRLKGEGDTPQERHLILARQIYFCIAKARTGFSNGKIGAFVNRDHSTVLHGARKIQDFIDTKQCFVKEHVELIKHGLGFVELEDSELKALEDKIGRSKVKQRLKAIFEASDSRFKGHYNKAIKVKSAFIVAARTHANIKDDDILNFLKIEVADYKNLGIRLTEHADITRAFNVIADLKQDDPDIEVSLKAIVEQANALLRSSLGKELGILKIQL